MVTIKTIAEQAGVSIATVSYVLNKTGNVSKETTDRVLQVVKELDYKPNKVARSLKVNRTQTIGIIAEDITVFNTPDIIDQINNYAEINGYYVLLNNLRIYKRTHNNFENVEKYMNEINGVIDVMLSHRVEGIIYIGCHSREIKNMLEDVKIPIVFAYCFSNAENTYSIINDEEFGGYQATKYLIDKGHQSIGVITGLINSIITQDRLKGYQKAVMDHQLIFNPVNIKVGDWTYDSGYQLGKELLSEVTRPTAIFVMNDIMAGGVIDAAKELKLEVPKDVSIIGFDNRECSFFYTPRLTTVALPLEEMGKEAAKALIQLIGKKKMNHQILKLQCKLIERNSVINR